jgi:hypothetical protein
VKTESAKKVPVSERALIARINRKLASREEVLKPNRSSKWESDLGSYYTLNVRLNSIVSKHLDLETVAKEEGVLKAHERLSAE